MRDRGSDDWDMAKTVGAGDHATSAEIDKALRALSDADLLRLHGVARFRAQQLAALGRGIDADDLLHDAITRTVAGERHWPVKVPFVKYLCETMRSIASHPPKHARMVPADDDDISCASNACDSCELAASRELLAMIAEMFKDDDEVSRVLGGLAAGKNGPDIQRDLGISATKYETIMTRLRRGARKLGGRA